MATIIKIRRGINGFKYAACDMDGNFIWNLNRLSEASQYWKKEIKTGNVRLIRELSLYPKTDQKNITDEDDTSCVFGAVFSNVRFFDR